MDTRRRRVELTKAKGGLRDGDSTGEEALADHVEDRHTLDFLNVLATFDVGEAVQQRPTIIGLQQ